MYHLTFVRYFFSILDPVFSISRFRMSTWPSHAADFVVVVFFVFVYVTGGNHVCSYQYSGQTAKATWWLSGLQYGMERTSSSH